MISGGEDKAALYAGPAFRVGTGISTYDTLSKSTRFVLGGEAQLTVIGTGETDRRSEEGESGSLHGDLYLSYDRLMGNGYGNRIGLGKRGHFQMADIANVGLGFRLAGEWGKVGSSEGSEEMDSGYVGIGEEDYSAASSSGQPGAGYWGLMLQLDGRWEPLPYTPSRPVCWFLEGGIGLGGGSVGGDGRFLFENHFITGIAVAFYSAIDAKTRTTGSKKDGKIALLDSFDVSRR